jgi:hypothetical protein
MRNKNPKTRTALVKRSHDQKMIALEKVVYAIDPTGGQPSQY